MKEREKLNDNTPLTVNGSEAMKTTYCKFMPVQLALNPSHFPLSYPEPS